MNETAVIGRMQKGAERENVSRVEKCLRQIGQDQAFARARAEVQVRGL
jgi:hypothetical protein